MVNLSLVICRWCLATFLLLFVHTCTHQLQRKGSATHPATINEVQMNLKQQINQNHRLLAIDKLWNDSSS